MVRGPRKRAKTTFTVAPARAAAVKNSDTAGRITDGHKHDIEALKSIAEAVAGIQVPPKRAKPKFTGALGRPIVVKTYDRGR